MNSDLWYNSVLLSCIRSSLRMLDADFGLLVETLRGLLSVFSFTDLLVVRLVDT